MTITTIVDRTEVTGTGSAPQDYAVSMVFWDDSEIVITHLTGIAAGVSTPTVLVDGVNYTHTAGGDGSTGTVNVTTPTIETDELLLIQRVLPLSQLFSFSGSGSFQSSEAQEATDKCIGVSQQVNGSLSVNSDLLTATDTELMSLGVEEELDGGLVAFDVTRSAAYNIFGVFQIASNVTINSPVEFHLHVGPLGTISDPEVVSRKIFFPGVVANTIYTFPVAWMNTFLSSTQKVTFGAEAQFSQLTIKAGSSVRIVEYVEKT